ncbi:precorrin-8X methylmutase [Shewanella sp. TC10]|uniref:precorrin-8X methylmutase n=1 Tax=Shewanella sp. TC10 TaxID=1419739 RepID=UPI001E34940C|nr:precorrin-8X methylmutase [Shewanella sp. TC10]
MSAMEQMTTKGKQIEQSSFAIIDLEIDRDHGGHTYTATQWAVVRRCIHTTGDFEFATLFKFSENATQCGIKAIQDGCKIITDVNMIVTGLAPRRMEPFNVSAHCLISNDTVIEQAKNSGDTRARVAMQHAAKNGWLDGAIIAVGNAPTALYEIIELCRQGKAKPALIIGLPVGFVKADESKACLVESGLPFIACEGRKGGSPLVVATLHALMVEAAQ